MTAVISRKRWNSFIQLDFLNSSKRRLEIIFPRIQDYLDESEWNEIDYLDEIT